MTETPKTSPATLPQEGGFGRFLRATEIDPRLLGMFGALMLIWLCFEAYSTVVLGRPSMLLGAAQAEANVIRRREETNATRSLLNTARVMAENPVMLRLKELEALETIAGKVERLTVHNGTGGLLNDLVKLRDG